MTFVTKRALPRRTFLRGMGTTVALPLLDAMIPALSAKSEKFTPRLGFVYVSNGVIQKQWKPATVGTGFELSPILKPLEKVRAHINVLSGLAHLQADTFGDGTGDHPRASAVWLTGVHAYDRTRPGVEVRLATTADQLAAAEIGKATQVPSLELNLDAPTQGACDSGDCFYVNTISWRNPTTPNPAESHPRVVFERLFGDTDNTDRVERLSLIRENRSILDSIADEVAGLTKQVGASDRTKINEYLEAVRDVERRIQIAEEQTNREVPQFERPLGTPTSFRDYSRLMIDLQVLAFQTDLTRVITFVLGREGPYGSRAYTDIGIADTHHTLSHHQNGATAIDKLAKINVFHTQTLAYYFEKLKSTPDGDGSLLDHIMLLYGSGLANGNIHQHDNLPLLLAGGVGGLKGGRHIRYKDGTPMANLLLTMLDKLGAPMEKFGDSNGKLDL